MHEDQNQVGELGSLLSSDFAVAEAGLAIDLLESSESLLLCFEFMLRPGVEIPEPLVFQAIFAHTRGALLC